MTTDPDPYAAPRTDVAPITAIALGNREAPDVAEALRRLRAHVADPVALAEDRRAAGPRIRAATWASLALVALVVAGAFAYAYVTVSDDVAMRAYAALGVVLLGLVAGVVPALLFRDLRLVSRSSPASPTATLSSFVHALRYARDGYAFASLCPDARSTTVEAPAFSPVVTASGEFVLCDPVATRRWATAFARGSTGQMRWMSVKRFTVLRADTDVAEIEAEVVFQSLPMWAYAVSLGLAVVARLIGLVVGAVVYFALRKRSRTRFVTTLVRDPRGVWYVLDTGLFHRATGG